MECVMECLIDCAFNFCCCCLCHSHKKIESISFEKSIGTNPIIGSNLTEPTTEVNITINDPSKPI